MRALLRCIACIVAGCRLYVGTQGFFTDLVKSPTGEATAKGPSEQSLGQPAAWEWGATEWTKGLLDIGSDAFAFGGREGPQEEGDGFWGYSPRTPVSAAQGAPHTPGGGPGEEVHGPPHFETPAPCLEQASLRLKACRLDHPLLQMDGAHERWLTPVLAWRTGRCHLQM